MLKGVIIGFGSAVETAYLPALKAQKENFDICAVCDPSPERLKKAGASGFSVGRFLPPLWGKVRMGGGEG